MPHQQTIAVTTDGSGDATAYSGEVHGRILNVIYSKTDFADGVDFTITTEITLQQVWAEENVNASKTVAPRQAIHSTAGVAALFASGGTAVLDYVWAVRERIKIVIANGGSAKTGSFIIITDE